MTQTAAYIVRKTYFDDTPHVDLGRFEVSQDFLRREREGLNRYTHAYTEALDLAQATRIAGHHYGIGYAVIDSEDVNGVRHAG